MCDYATMNTKLHAWGVHAIASLNQHLSQAVSHLLPEDLEVLAVNLDLVLEKVRPGGAPRAVSSFTVSPPADFEATPFDVVARRVLSDLQDEVAMYLRKPWPELGGVALHAWAEEVDGVIRLFFRGEGAHEGAAPVVLPPFPLPPRPTGTVVVGS